MRRTKKIIDDTIHTHKLDEIASCEAISIEGCKEPPNFEALHASLAHTNISYASPCNITIKNCSYGGALFVNSTSNLVKSAQKKDQHVFFNVTLDEASGKSK